MEDTEFEQRLGKEQGKETNVGTTSSITPKETQAHRQDWGEAGPDRQILLRTLGHLRGSPGRKGGNPVKGDEQQLGRSCPWS